MKSFITTLIITLFLATPIKAQVGPEFSLSTAIVNPGSTTSLPLNLSNGTEPYAGANAKIILPEGITITGISKGSALSNSFITDWKTFSEKSDKGIILIAYSGSDTFSANGELLTLNIQADNNASVGEYPVNFATTNSNPQINSKYALSSAGGERSIIPSVFSGTIIISDDSDNDNLPDAWEQKIINADTGDSITTIQDVNPEDDFDKDGQSNITEYSNNTDPTDPASNTKTDPGDLDKDGDITLADAITGLKIISGITSDNEDMTDADVNDDDKIGIEEVIYVLGFVSED